MKASTVLPRIVVAVTVLVLLAGCSTPTKADPTMNHREAKAELSDLYLAVEDAVGGDWVRQYGGAEGCGLPSGASGARYPLSRLGPGVPLEQQQKVIDAVVSAWTDAGFKVKVSTLPEYKGIVVTEIGYPGARAGTGVDGIYMLFGVSTSGTALNGQTRCVPGDAAKINSAVRNAQERK
jgi:hypothetical protein